MEQHYQYSIRLLEQFKEILRKSIDSDLKSQIYQSFYFLIKSNAKLSQPISALLLKQVTLLKNLNCFFFSNFTFWIKKKD